jgi:hypothetical protein
MSPRVGRVHPALKHGAYSAMGVLPGENRAEFEKLHRELINDFSPSGAFENDVIVNMARILWRKKNLRTLSTAKFARDRYSAIIDANVDSGFRALVDPVRHEEQMHAAEDQAQKELGEAYGFIKAGEAATLDGLTKELNIEERLDAGISRCLKQLLLVRGVKSISETPLPTSRPKQITGPSKAA